MVFPGPGMETLVNVLNTLALSCSLSFFVLVMAFQLAYSIRRFVRGWK